jgi:ribosomal protein S12 methylthiotransferase accessory factor
MNDGGSVRLPLLSSIKTYTHAQDKVLDPTATVRAAVEKLGGMSDLPDVRLEARAEPLQGAYSYASKSKILNSSGKGLTPEQAQASAIMEFAERYSWLHFDYPKAEGYVCATYDEIAKGTIRTVEPSYFLNNFKNLQDGAALLAEIRTIPLRFVLGTSLPDHEPFYYPLNWHNMVFTANGLAAGNTKEEAILQALCEVIERENIYRLFVDQRPGVAIDCSSIEHPLLSTVFESARVAGIEFVIRDISSDLGPATFIVQGTCAADRHKLTHRGVGQGTHPDPYKALMRAVSEYFESYYYIRGVQKEIDIDWSAMRALVPQLNFGFINLFNEDMLEKSVGARRMDEVQSLARADIKDEIELLVERLSRLGFAVVVIDKTYAPLNIPMFRVFVPQMRSNLNVSISSPETVISMVWGEAGNTQASDRYWQQAFDSMVRDAGGPALTRSSMARRLLKESVAARPLIVGDYRVNLRRLGVTKTSALEQLKQLKQYHGLIGLASILMPIQRFLSFSGMAMGSPPEGADV